MQIKIIAESQEQHVSTINSSMAPAFLMLAKARPPTPVPSKIVLIAKEQPPAHFAQHVPLSHPNISSIPPTPSVQLAQ